jgi:hypothetical protein
MLVMKVACVDMSHNEIVLFAISLIFIMSPCLLILCSYIRNFATIWIIPSQLADTKLFPGVHLMSWLFLSSMVQPYSLISNPRVHTLQTQTK